MWKKNINFCHLLKIGFKQILPCQKISVFEIECTHFNQRKEIYVKEDYQFCHLSKNVFRQKLPCQKVSVFEISHTIFI